MTEQDLIDLGFEKVEVPKKDSGMDNDYYFYSHFGTGIEFFSNCNDEILSDDWYVSILEDDLWKIYSKTEIKLIIDIINKNKIK